MKEETKGDLIFYAIISGLIMLFCAFFWFVLISPEINKHKLCYESMGGEDFNAWDTPNYSYRAVGLDHFNCCLDGVSLSDEGYYVDEKCKGFKKEVEEK